MSPFIKKRIVTQETLGEKLRKIRFGKNWTLDVASEKTNISRHHLEALEQSSYDDIPGEVYIKNFIRVYSKNLGFNPHTALEKYRLERHVIEVKKHSHVLKEIEKINFFQTLLKPRTIKISAICIVISTVLSYIAFSIYQTIAPPQLIIYHPQNNIEVNDSEIKIFGKSENETRVVINNNETIVNEEGLFEENIHLREGLNLIVISARRKHGMERKEILHILVTSHEPIAHLLKIYK